MSFFFNENAKDEPAQKKRHVEQPLDGSFRGGFSHPGGADDDDDERPVLAPAGGDRVGLRLLQDMRQPPSRCRPATSSAAPPAGPGRLCVVEEYVPLSKGGFMETATASVMDDMDHVRPGNVMCLRCPASTAPAASAEVRFVKETDLTEEEQRYGKRITSDMTQELFEVGRVDRVAGLLEAVFLDGTRQKLRICAVRPAGFVETELFNRWKRDPSSRPVRTVYATPNDAKAPSPRPTTHASTALSAEDNKNSNSDVATVTPTPWWVIPQLIVRIVEEGAGDLFGKRFVVKSVLRKEKKIRLAPWNLKSGSDELSENSLVDIVGCEALETIVPKVNEEGIVVLGKMRGELIKVIERHRSAEGELNGVKVCSTLTGSEFTVGPHEVCRLALPQR